MGIVNNSVDGLDETEVDSQKPDTHAALGFSWTSYEDS